MEMLSGDGLEGRVVFGGRRTGGDRRCGCVVSLPYPFFSQLNGSAVLGSSLLFVFDALLLSGCLLAVCFSLIPTTPAIELCK